MHNEIKPSIREIKMRKIWNFGVLGLTLTSTLHAAPREIIDTTKDVQDITITPQEAQPYESIYQILTGGALNILGNINADLGGKSFIDLQGGNALINPQENSTIKLKGHITGKKGGLEMSLGDGESYFNGNLSIYDTARATLNLSNGATATINLELGQGTRDSSSSASFILKGGSTLDLNVVKAQTNTRLNINVENAKLLGKFNLINNHQSTFSFSGEDSHFGSADKRIELKAEDSTKSTLVFSEKAKAFMDLYFKESAELEASFNHASLKGKLDLKDATGAQINFNLSNQSQGTLESLYIDGNPTMVVTLRDSSTLKINNVSFSRITRPVEITFKIDNSKLHANFTPEDKEYGNVYIKPSNNGTWITSQNSKVWDISFGNQGIVDLRYDDLNANTLRTLNSIDVNNRRTLTTNTIHGENGNFYVYGIFDPKKWSKEKEGTVATDKIVITKEVSGTHTITFFWDPKQIVKDMSFEELQQQSVIVAEQMSKEGNGTFLGATAMGLLDYDTPLRKVETAQGYKWIIGIDDENPPPQPPNPPDPNPEPLPPLPPVPLPPEEDEKPITLPNPRPSYLAKTLNALFVSPYKIFITQTQTLHQRMGDIRKINSMNENDEIAGAFFKINYGILDSQESTDSLNSLTMHTNIALGADYSTYTSVGKNYIGASFNTTVYQDYGDYFQGSPQAFLGNSVAYGLSAYDSFVFNNSFYLDAVVKYYFADHTYDFYSPDLKGTSSSFFSYGLIGSLEMGYKIKLPIITPNLERSFYYLKPQANLTLGKIYGIEGLNFKHTTNYDIQAQLLETMPILPALSFDFGRRFDNDLIFGDVFLTFGFEYALNAGNTLQVQTPFNEGVFLQRDYFNLKLGIGGNLISKNGTRFYYDLTSRFLGRIQPLLDMHVGVRVPFGEKRREMIYPQTQFNSNTQTNPYPRRSNFYQGNIQAGKVRSKNEAKEEERRGEENEQRYQSNPYQKGRSSLQDEDQPNFL